MATLGKKYRDKVNGFVGTAVAETRWLYACNRITLSALHNGDLVELTFDVDQLEELPEPGVKGKPERKKTGGGSSHSNPRR